jgi:hypothetical protein
LDGVLHRGDPAHPHDRDADPGPGSPDGVDAHGPHGRSAEPARSSPKGRSSGIGIEDQARQRVDQRETVGPVLFRHCRGGGDVGIVRSELDQYGSLRSPTHARDHLGQGLAIQGKGAPAQSGVVRAAEVQLEAVEALVLVQGLHQPQVLLTSMARQADQHPRKTNVVPEPGDLLRSDRHESGIGQPDGVDHGTRHLGHPGCRVSETWLDRHRLGHEPTQSLQVDHVLELQAETAGTRGEKDRILKIQAEDRLFQIHVGSGTPDVPPRVASASGSRNG